MVLDEETRKTFSFRRSQFQPKCDLSYTKSAFLVPCLFFRK